MRIKVIIAIIVIIIIAFLAWLFWASTRPLPGTRIDDLGRGHVDIGTEVKYNSFPPTSGQHYEDWIRAGVYTEPKDDRNLVHSLEHGYVVMHYRCNLPVIPANAGIQLTESSAELDSRLRGNDNKEIATDSSASRNDENGVDTQADCDQRKAQLEEIYNKKGKRKLIVVARPNLDTSFALTAWNYLDKFDPSTSSGLSVNEVERIEKFIDAHLNNGPERTME